MALPIALVTLGIVILLVSIGMTLGLVPALTEALRDVAVEIAGYVSSISIIVYAIWRVVPEPIKGIIAKGMRRIPNLPAYYKRQTIKFEIESEVNRALKGFGKEGAGFIEHEVVVSWLTPKEEARRLFFRGGKAYLKLDFDEDKERTLVEAVVMYCNECLLPEIRQYIPRPLMRSIDLTFIDQLLDRRNAVRGRAHFVQEVIPREIYATPDIQKYLDDLALICQHGLFVRALMPELKEYPGRTQRGIPRKNHLAQVEEFIAFLKTTAEDRTRVDKRAWLHLGETVRVGIILVGLTDKLTFQGSKPYVRRTALHNAAGARTVYLIGYNLGVDFVAQIAREAQQRGLAANHEAHPYTALIGHEVKRQVIARLSVPDGAGTRFLDSHPSTAEWPDLEEETQRSVIRQKPEKWEYDIDTAWSKRAPTRAQPISGPVAAGDAAKVFGVPKLRDGNYKTLRAILTASDYLSDRWVREENKITRR